GDVVDRGRPPLGAVGGGVGVQCAVRGMDVDLVTVVREHDRHAETAPVEIDPPQLVEVARVIVGETDGHELGRRGTGSPRREVDRAGVGVHGGGAGCRTPALAGTTPGRAVADVGGGDLPG